MITQPLAPPRLNPRGGAALAARRARGRSRRYYLAIPLLSRGSGRLTGRTRAAMPVDGATHGALYELHSPEFFDRGCSHLLDLLAPASCCRRRRGQAGPTRPRSRRSPPTRSWCCTTDPQQHPQVGTARVGATLVVNDGRASDSFQNCGKPNPTAWLLRTAGWGSRRPTHRGSRLRRVGSVRASPRCRHYAGSWRRSRPRSSTTCCWSVCSCWRCVIAVAFRRGRSRPW